jgi:hypothetical protein
MQTLVNQGELVDPASSVVAHADAPPLRPALQASTNDLLLGILGVPRSVTRLDLSRGPLRNVRDQVLCRVPKQSLHVVFSLIFVSEVGSLFGSINSLNEKDEPHAVTT